MQPSSRSCCTTGNSRACVHERRAKVDSGTIRITRPTAVRRFVDFHGAVEGFLKIDADDFSRFVVDSDDGAVLEIDGEVVVDNDGNHTPRTIAAMFPLRRGLHKFRLRLAAEAVAYARRRLGETEWRLQPLEASSFSTRSAVRLRAAQMPTCTFTTAAGPGRSPCWRLMIGRLRQCQEIGEPIARGDLRRVRRNQGSALNYLLFFMLATGVHRGNCTRAVKSLDHRRRRPPCPDW